MVYFYKLLKLEKDETGLGMFNVLRNFNGSLVKVAVGGIPGVFCLIVSIVQNYIDAFMTDVTFLQNKYKGID